MLGIWSRGWDECLNTTAHITLRFPLQEIHIKNLPFIVHSPSFIQVVDTALHICGFIVLFSHLKEVTISSDDASRPQTTKEVHQVRTKGRQEEKAIIGSRRVFTVMLVPIIVVTLVDFSKTSVAATA
jgi:hypothetical protein